MADVRVGGIYADFKMRNAQFLTQAKRNTEALRRQQRAVRGLQRSVRQFNQAAGAMAGRLGLLAGLGLVLAIRSFAKFGDTMAQVRGISGATAEEFARLEKHALRLGRTTRFTATQVAEGQLFLARTGFDTAQVIGALPATLRLAEAAAVDLGTAADIVSNILKAFGKEAESTEEAADQLATVFSAANTDLIQLGEAMKLVAPIAKSLDISLVETAAAIGVVSDAGIQATRAGTGLRSVLFKLTNPTEDSAKILRRYGLQVEDVAPHIVGLVESIERLAKANLNQKDIFKLFDLRGSGVFINLQDNLGRFRNLVELSEKLSGITRRLSALRAEQLLGGFLKLKSAAEGFGIELIKVSNTGNALNSSLNSLANGINRLTDNLSQYINRIVHISQLLLIGFILRTRLGRALVGIGKHLFAIARGLVAVGGGAAILAKGVRGLFLIALRPLLIVEGIFQLINFLININELLEKSKVSWAEFGKDVGIILLEEFNKLILRTLAIFINLPNLILRFALDGFVGLGRGMVDAIKAGLTGKDITEAFFAPLSDGLTKAVGSLQEILDDSEVTKLAGRLDYGKAVGRATNQTRKTLSDAANETFDEFKTLFSGVAEPGTNLTSSLEEQRTLLQEQQEILEKINENENERKLKNVELTEAQQELKSIGQGVGQATGQFAKDLITDFENIEDAVKNLGKAIVNAILDILIVQRIANAISNSTIFGGSGIGTAADGGHRQGLTLVGERGPEIVDFRNPARVYTNEDLADAVGRGGGSGGGVNITFAPTIQSADAPAVQRALIEAMPTIRDLVTQGIAQDSRRPGQFRRAIRG